MMAKPHFCRFAVRGGYPLRVFCIICGLRTPRMESLPYGR